MTILNIAKLIKFNTPPIFCNLLNIDTLKLNKRLSIPKLKLNQHQNNFLYQAPNLWNLIASSSKNCALIINSPSINNFKKKLKSFLIQMQSYGSQTEWYKFNHSISDYLTAIRKDPYSN